MEYKLQIRIPEVFKGSLEGWENEFFTFEDITKVGDCLEHIFNFCKDMQMDVEVLWIAQR